MVGSSTTKQIFRSPGMQHGMVPIMANVAADVDFAGSHGPVEIVDLPMKNGGSFHSCVSLPEDNWYSHATSRSQYAYCRKRDSGRVQEDGSLAIPWVIAPNIAVASKCGGIFVTPTALLNLGFDFANDKGTLSSELSWCWKKVIMDGYNGCWKNSWTFWWS